MSTSEGLLPQRFGPVKYTEDQLRFYGQAFVGCMFNETTIPRNPEVAIDADDGIVQQAFVDAHTHHPNMRDSIAKTVPKIVVEDWQPDLEAMPTLEARRQSVAERQREAGQPPASSWLVLQKAKRVGAAIIADEQVQEMVQSVKDVKANLKNTWRRKVLVGGLAAALIVTNMDHLDQGATFIMDETKHATTITCVTVARHLPLVQGWGAEKVCGDAPTEGQVSGAEQYANTQGSPLYKQFLSNS